MSNWGQSPMGQKGRWNIVNWYLQIGNDYDTVKSTKISLSRNVNGITFDLRNQEEREKLEKKIENNLYNIGYGLQFLRLKDMDEITKYALVEKELISPEFASQNKQAGSILINDDENICIMIGEEEHLKIQAFSTGLDLENTLNLAVEVDKKIGEIIGYSVNKKYGYLTKSLNNVGTGLKATVVLHLPALSATRNINKIENAIGNFGMAINAVNDVESQNSGDMYQILNKQTIGVTETDIIQNLKAITDKIIKQEREARRLLAKDNINIEDKIFRSYGILANCKKISYEEAKKLMSYVKLGVDLGLVDELTDAKVQQLYLYIKSANLQKYLGEQCEALERDIKRAEVIKKIMRD